MHVHMYSTGYKIEISEARFDLGINLFRILNGGLYLRKSSAM